VLLLTVSIASAQQPEAPATLHLIQENGLTVQVTGATDDDWREIQSLLRDQITLSGDTSPSEPLADDLAFFTRQYYIRAGRPDALVIWEINAGGIVLNVSAGVEIIVGDITWSGDLVVEEEELRRFLLRRSLEKEGADKNHPKWVDAELRDGVGFVQRRIRAEGFLQAEVTMKPAPLPRAGGERDISVHIKAGPRSMFGVVQLIGAPPELELQMLNHTRQEPDTPFSEARVQQLERRLTSIAYDNGYLRARTLSHYNLGSRGGTVDVVMEVQSGPAVRIDTITPHPAFSGGSKRILRGIFRSSEGEFYSQEEMDLNFRRALDTGIFARLDMDPQIEPYGPGDTIATADLLLTGEEAKPQTLGFQIGFDTFLGAQVGVTYRDVNFRDTGNSLETELRWSPVGPTGFIKLTDPAILNTRFASSVRLGVDNFERFEYTRYGANIAWELSRRVSVPFAYSIFMGASGNTVDSDTLTVRELGPMNYTLAYIGASMTLDFRDSPVLPTRGWWVTARVESTMDVFGSNVDFIRTDLRGGWHHTFAQKLRLSIGGALMSIQGADVNEIPIDSRVFNGGPNSVRSFSEREMGPKTPGGTPLGGTSAFFSSAELSYEIYKNLEFAIFTDIGSLSRRNNTSPFQYSSDLRIAAGAGLRYRLPFGPIRLDYGHNLNRGPNEPSGTLHLTFGFSF
jgi:outer membrane protein assembly factor BamA